MSSFLAPVGGPLAGADTLAATMLGGYVGGAVAGGAVVVAAGGVTLSLLLGATTIERLEDAGGLWFRDVAHQAFNVRQVLDASTTPRVRLVSEQILDGASGTLDLTSLPTAVGSRSAASKRLVLLRVRNLGTSPLTIEDGETDPYSLGGQPLVIPAGGTAAYYFANELAHITGETSQLDWTMGSAESSAELTLVFG